MSKLCNNTYKVKVYDKEVGATVNFEDYPEYSDSIARASIGDLLNTKYWAIVRDKFHEAIYASEYFKKEVNPIIYISRKDIELLADDREPAAAIKTPHNVEVKLSITVD